MRLREVSARIALRGNGSANEIGFRSFAKPGAASTAQTKSGRQGSTIGPGSSWLLNKADNHLVEVGCAGNEGRAAFWILWVKVEIQRHVHGIVAKAEIKARGEGRLRRVRGRSHNESSQNIWLAENFLADFAIQQAFIEADLFGWMTNGATGGLAFIKSTSFELWLVVISAQETIAAVRIAVAVKLAITEAREATQQGLVEADLFVPLTDVSTVGLARVEADGSKLGLVLVRTQKSLGAVRVSVAVEIAFSKKKTTTKRTGLLCACE